MRYLLAAVVLAVAMPWHAYAAGDQAGSHRYLYNRDLVVPPFQSLRELFDLPNQPGTYEVTLVSDAMGPLTFKVMRVLGEKETVVKQYRSYRFHNHEFHLTFDNSDGQSDLMVGIANSNPASSARVTVIVIQLP